MSNLNVVAHNITSMFSNRQLGITNKNLAKSTEKLSSGYKINRSADDSSGLAISERMRRFIRGLSQGSENILDGINMIQTADGALNEVHDILQRMNEIAVKGLNGSQSHKDRRAIQEEIDALYAEIRRIGDTTVYNELPILQGNPLVEHTVETGTTTVVNVDLVRSADGMPTSYVSYEGISNTGGKKIMTLGGSNGTTQPSNSGTSYKTVNDETISNNTWSSELDDNYGCTLNFSNLAQTFGDDLDFYNALKEFVGTGFYTTCNTCNEQYNIVFTDSDGRYVFRPDNNVSYGATVYVDLTDLLEEAKEASTESDSQRLTTKFIELIASKASSNTHVQDHYTRYKADSSDPYKLFIYDFRDYTNDVDDYRYDYTIPPDADKETGMLGDISGRVYVYDISVEVTSGTYLSRESLNIQHGDESNNNSKINLPNLNAMFDIYTKYGYSSIEDSLTLEEYYPETTTIKTTGGSYSSYTETIPSYTYQQANYTTTPPRVYYEAGEKKTEYFPPTISGYTTVTVPEKTVTRYTYTGGTSTKITTPEHYGELNFPILSVISDLINCVSKMRSDLGASQNRLEHSFKLNEDSNENLQMAESKIRDTDMASEMVVFSKNKILQQAGQSMLSQANQANQGVLNLLQ